jgi:hypothetical protein
VIRDDRELLAELARLNSDVVPLAMRIMDETVTAGQQYVFARRLIAMATRLQAGASTPWRVVAGEVVKGDDTPSIVASYRES